METQRAPRDLQRKANVHMHLLAAMLVIDNSTNRICCFVDGPYPPIKGQVAHSIPLTLNPAKAKGLKAIRWNAGAKGFMSWRGVYGGWRRFIGVQSTRNQRAVGQI